MALHVRVPCGRVGERAAACCCLGCSGWRGPTVSSVSLRVRVSANMLLLRDGGLRAGGHEDADGSEALAPVVLRHLGAVVELKYLHTHVTVGNCCCVTAVVGGLTG